MNKWMTNGENNIQWKSRKNSNKQIMVCKERKKEKKSE